MNAVVRLFQAIMWTAAFLVPGWTHATSHRLDQHKCPVCGKESWASFLASYSNFGEPARDFSDSPMFAFQQPTFCPWDLYAAGSTNWELESGPVRDRIAAILKQEKPAIEVSALEWEVAGKLKESEEGRGWLDSLRERWWVRTLHGKHETPETRWRETMRLYFLCRDTLPELVPLENAYRDQAFSLLEILIAAAKPEEGCFYQYIKGTLLLAKNKKPEALTIFAGLADRFEKMPREQLAKWHPVSIWSFEQAERLRMETKSAAEVAALIPRPLPNPFREAAKEREKNPQEEELVVIDSDNDDGSWLPSVDSVKQTLAFEMLIERAEAGEKEANEELWNLLARSADQLVAAGEITGSLSLEDLVPHDPRWGVWRDEMEAQLRAGKIPEGANVEINQERNENILRGAVGLSDFDDKEDWMRGEEMTPEGQLRAMLRWIDPFEEERDLAKARKAVRQALDVMRKLQWKDPLGSEKELGYYDYPLDSYSEAFAEEPELFAAEIRDALAKPWADPFFRDMAALWAGDRNALQRLEANPAILHEPRHPGYGPQQMVYEFLIVKKDPAWWDRAKPPLLKPVFMNDCLKEYAKCLDLPEAMEVMQKRYERLSEVVKQKFDDPTVDLFQNDLLEFEEEIARRKLASLELKVVEP